MDSPLPLKDNLKHLRNGAPKKNQEVFLALEFSQATLSTICDLFGATGATVGHRSL